MADPNKDLDDVLKRHYKDFQNEQNRLQNETDRALRELRNEHRSQPSNGSIFATFRRFVDDNLATFAGNFKNFPSNLSELRENMQQEQRRQQEVEQDISRRWTGSPDSPDHIAMTVARRPQAKREYLSEDTQAWLQAAARWNAYVPLHKIISLYEDREAGFGLLDQLASPLLSLGGTWYYMPETGDTLPTASNWSLLGSPSPRWLSVDWFKRSPYSPLRLEAHPDLQAEGGKWRSAFEDLMHAALDKPMRDQFNPRRELCRGVEWVLDLQIYGILPPLLPRFYSDVNARRALEHTSILDIIRNCHAPEGAERSLPWLDPLTRDFAELRAEVEVRQAIHDEDGPRMPETELDMYDQYPHNGTHTLRDYQKQITLLEKQEEERKVIARQLRAHLDAQYADGAPEEPDDDDDDDDESEADFADEDEDEDDIDGDADLVANQFRRQAVQMHEWQQRHQNAGLVLTGRRNEDFEAARVLFATYIQHGDVDSAGKILDCWYKQYREPGTINSFALDALNPDHDPIEIEKWSKFAEATNRSEVPRKASHENDWWGWIEIGLGDTREELEEMGEQKNKRGELMRRYEKIRGQETWDDGHYSMWAMDLGKLEANVESLEQQVENLERMTRMTGRTQPPAMPVPEPVRSGKEGDEVRRRPDVLSALTTTQTTRLPDGTVTTKVVLKKRFVDGREECSESVHTHHEGVEAEIRRKAQEEEEQAKAKSGRGKGWFWS